MERPEEYFRGTFKHMKREGYGWMTLTGDRGFIGHYSQDAKLDGYEICGRNIVRSVENGQVQGERIAMDIQNINA